MSMQDLRDEAIELERLSRDYYLELERKSIAKYAGGALRHLAGEEQKHMDILAKYRATLERGGTVTLPPSSSYEATWQGFMDALDQIREAIAPHTDEVTVVQRAITLEEKGLAVYGRATQSAQDATGRKLFAFLADQEKRHKAYFEKLLNRLLMLYEEPPETRPQL